MLPDTKISATCWQNWMSQWSELLLSGMPVMDALELSTELQGQCRQSRLLQTKLQRCQYFLQSGQNLQTAFRAAFGKLPQALEVALLCAQANGELGPALTEQLQRWKNTSGAHQALAKSLIYPAVVLTLALACWMFLHQVSAPHLQATLHHTTTGVAEILLALGVLLLVVAVCARQFGKGQPDTTSWLPHHAWQASDFYFLIACELQAGLDLLHCLRYRTMPGKHRFASAINNNQTHNRLNELTAKIQMHLKAGMTLSQAMSKANAPTFLIRQSQLAEQTGNLHYCFSLASKVYEMRANHAQQRLQSILPPLALALAAITLAMAYQFTLAPLYANLAGLP